MIRLLRACFAVVLLVVILLAVVLNQLSRYYWQKPNDGAQAVHVSVTEGQGGAQVAEMLEETGVIANAFWFRVGAKFSGMSNRIQVGEYDLMPGERYKTLLAILTAGTSRADAQVTVPEGYTIKQIGELLVQKGWTTTEEWAELTGINSPFESHAFIVAAQKPDNVDLEGYLFPDTYRFYTDATAEEIVATMINTMERRVNQLGVTPRGDAEGMTLHEVLTLASIVEREVRQPETMKNVADIFLKRLDINMPLQADSTVNYVIDGDSPSITLDQRDNTDSPYNTYKYPGLPPGPISNPGLNAIDAVLNPIHNEYFYFLTTDSGDIHYAVTHEEHVENKNRYLR